MPTKEILDDFATNNTDTMIEDYERQEWLQERFTRAFRRFGKLKEAVIRPMHSDTK